MKPSLDSLDLNALPEDVRMVLLAVNAARVEAEKRAAKFEDYAKRLEHLVAEFKRALFGRKSEKISADQLELAFEELETAASEAEAEKADVEAKAGTSCRPKPSSNRNLGHLPKEFPRVENLIEPDSIQCPCGCGEMVRIGEDRSERLDITPAQFQVIVTIRSKYACRKNCDGKPVQAPASAFLIEGALPTEALIAHVMVSKYADHLPLYRQSQIFARGGIDLHRSTLAGWVGKAAFHLRPIADRMAKHLKTSSNLFMDETTAPCSILEEARPKLGIYGQWLATTVVGATMIHPASFSIMRQGAVENMQKNFCQDLTAFYKSTLIPDITA